MLICKYKSRRWIIGLKTNLGFSEICPFYYFKEIQVIEIETGEGTETQCRKL